MSANNQESRFTREWLSDSFPLKPMANQHAIDAGLSARLIQGKAVPVTITPLRDDEIAKVVNECRRIALDFGGSQQLREHLRAYLAPILKGEVAP